MDNLSLILQLFAAGLIIGLMLSIAAASVINGICQALLPDIAERKLGLILLMIYVPLFIFLMRDMTEVTPMIVGVALSSALTSTAVLVKNIRAIKNPHSLPNAG